MKKAIILLSGGLDSTTCLAYAKQQGFACYALSFDYGQKHNIELEQAKYIGQHYHVIQHKIVSLASLGQLGGSALTDPNIPIPQHTDSDDIPSTYVPARNTVFLSIALSWSEIINASSIFIGVSAVDYSGYPDCRPEFIDAFQTLTHVATKTGVTGHAPRIETPLIHLSKSETIALGCSLGVEYAMTISCYAANAAKEACGECDSCILRKKGFIDAGIKDPTCYAT